MTSFQQHPDIFVLDFAPMEQKRFKKDFILQVKLDGFSILRKVDQKMENIF
jgi:hypothetical protein